MISRLAIAAILCLGASFPVCADQISFNFTGNFSVDNDV
jgi:hypothetical protein